MWISQAELFKLVERGSRAETRATVLESQNAVLQTTMDWQRTRLQQLEIERAQLLFSMTGVKVPVPVVERLVEQDPMPRGVDLFADMGDDEAKRQGIEWDDFGNLVSRK